MAAKTVRPKQAPAQVEGAGAEGLTACLCGHEFESPVTTDTKGLCPKCSRSLWMQAARAEAVRTGDKRARQIALHLNRQQFQLCTHQQDPCISKCGVQFTRGPSGTLRWWPIPLAERLAWFDRQLDRQVAEGQ